MQRLPRLAIAALPGLDHFLPALTRGLAASDAVEVRIFPVRGPSDLPAALAWTDQPERDAVWFEFCWPPFPALIAATDFAGRRVIVRVHRIEVYETDHVARTTWGKVSDLIVVSEDMARCAREARSGIDGLTRLRVIHNGVDLGDYPDPRDDSGRAGFDPFRIGWCGAFSARKNPVLAAHVLHELRRADPRYHLHLAISAADRLTMECFCHHAAILRLADAITFDGRLAAAAIPAWHAANGVLLSTSLHESFGYAIAEAAAAGCDLAVLDHLGAAEFWPVAVRFVTAARAVALIRDAAPGRWRALVADRFALPRQVAAVLAMLAEPREPSAAPAAGSALYWDERYRRGHDCGAGSAGRLALFKAAFLNRLVADRGVRSVLELGCGDGRQLALADYPDYVGVDVSPTAVAMCRDRFAADRTKRFLLAGRQEPDGAELTLSLDVVFHLIEDPLFEAHMRALFAHARRLVVVYSSDRDEPTVDTHVRHRSVSAWVAAHAPGWRRTMHVANPYPFDPTRPAETSFADFHVYERRDDGA
jgi:glycosyltransferase involved in cell wall biosynthesis/SAM-dependent methyltransferase